MIEHSLQSSPWKGALELSYDWHDDKTQVIHAQATAPLKVQRPFYPEGGHVCHSVLLHTAGGVVGGDRLSMMLHLQPQTRVLLTTAAASKIYRSTGAEAQQTMRVMVESGACLEWLPQETIVFNGAVYRQNIRVELSPGAVWCSWEIIRFGRSARGEQFQQGRWRSSTEVWLADQPLWVDRQQLIGGSPLINQINGLDGQSVIGTLVLVGQTVDSEVVALARSRWQPSSPTSEAGVTQLPSGILCRYRGQSTSEVYQWFIAVWNLLRLHCMARPACIPRVWQIRDTSLVN